MSAAADASAAPRAIPPAASVGQCARSVTRATATSTITTTATTLTRRRAGRGSPWARWISAPKKAVAAVAWPLGKPIERSSGRGRPTIVFSRPSVAGASSINPIQSHQRARAGGTASTSRTVAGSSTFQLPARLITRIAARRPGGAWARSASRTGTSTAVVSSVITARVSSATHTAAIPKIRGAVTGTLYRVLPKRRPPRGDEKDEPQRDQRQAEGADDRRPRGQIENGGGGDAENAHERAEAPADQEFAPYRGAEHDPGERVHDQVREHEQHAGDADRAGHDDAERRVEEEVPQPHPPALAERRGGVRRDEEERPPAEPVEDADRRVERGDQRHLVAAHRKEVADEHRPHLLGAVRRTVGQEDGRRRRHRVDDADHSLLRNVPPPATRHCEHEGPEQRGGEPARVRLPRVELVAQEERRGGAEGRDLGERDVHEDDLARQHVDAEVGVDPRQHEAHEEGHPEEGEELGGHGT